MLNQHHTEDARKRISNKLIGRKLSEDTIKKMIKNHVGNTGKTASEETRKKMSLAHLGRIVIISEETKVKMSNAHKGKKLSDKHKQAISHSLKGRPGRIPSAETRLKWSIQRKGRKVTEETKRKISIATKGDKCCHWRGGITPESKKIRYGIESRLWREAVLARDNYTCQKYNIKGGCLVAHHIQNFAQFPELRFAINNGITLSDKAHRDFHRKYGHKNNTKEQIEEFLVHRADSILKDIEGL
ncbi:MAG: NUMOD3 domain-containing DNA-binding protein [Candidatus Izemoplasmatales bacterium]